MPDLLFPSDSEYGIPTLLHSRRESAPPPVQAPLVIYGSRARHTRAVGTVAFYTDDYRFNGLWARPEIAASEAVEPNYSIFEDTPLAVALWHVYRKRWLARYWQSMGVTVWVDLCVAYRRLHDGVALLGVPLGWQRYATAGFDARVDDLQEEYDVAARHSDGNPFTLLVYGGGLAVKCWCASRSHVVHAAHRRDGQARDGEWTRRRRRQDGQE